MKILIADKTVESARDVRKSLAPFGFTAEVTASAEEVFAQIRERPPEVLLLDTALPERTGFAVCRALREARETSALPIVLLTSSDSELDRIMALEAGADDVVRRPYYARELALRLVSVKRRSCSDREADSRNARAVVIGSLQLNPDTGTVMVEGRNIELTTAERAILGLLAKRPGRAFRREEILDAMGSAARGRTPRVIDTHIKVIRRKLGGAGELIKTIRGVGYRLEAR